jgi:hypothetical protein
MGNEGKVRDKEGDCGRRKEGGGSLDGGDEKAKRGMR